MRSLVRWNGTIIMFISFCLGFQWLPLNLIRDVIASSLLWLRIGSVVLSFLSSSKLQSKLWWLLAGVLGFRFVVGNLFSFYVLFELRLVPILLMIVFWGRQPERLSAGLYFLLYTRIFSIPFLVLIMFVYPFLTFSYLEGGVLVSGWLRLFLLIPFLVKMPVIGLHFWLPKAHVEASTRGSIILAGLLLKLGRYGALRVTLMFSIYTINWTLPYWLFGSIIRSIITFIIRDIKKLVAYSRVSHITFIMLAIISSNKFIFMVVLILSLAHGWASIGMFARAGILGNVSGSRIGVLMSTESKMRGLIMLLGVLLLSNASLPPFPSFFPELALVALISFTISMVAFFILLRVVVCYFNTYIFMWFSHKGRRESLRLFFRFRGRFQLMRLNILSLLTLAWLQCL